MARAKQQELTLEEKIKQALVPEDEQPYKVPGNWVWTRIKELCILRNGMAFKPADWCESGLPIVRIQNLNNLNAPFNYYSGDVADENRLYGGELLFAWSGTPGTSFGAHIWYGKDAILNQHIFRVDFNATLLNKVFLMYAINQQLDLLISVAHGGAGLQHVTKGVFESTPIPLPPLAEQLRIVDRIESLFEKLDQAKELAQNALDTFETRKAAILHKAFTGELTAKWREMNGVGMESWEESSIGNLFNVFSGKGFKEKEYASEGVKLLRITNVTYNNLNWDDTKYLPVCYLETEKDLILQENDIVMALNRPITNNKLKVSIVDRAELYILYQRVGCMRLKVDSNSRFYLYYMLSNKFKKQVELQLQGSDQPYINLPPLKKITCPVCSLPEQQEIVRILDNLFEKEEQAKELCDVIDKIDLMKKAILARAFRGELGTNDPSEESAMELLKEFLGQPSN